MTFLWIATVVSLAASLLAWRLARRSAKRADQLFQMYWELKYQHGELRSQVRRVTGGGSPIPSVTPPEPPPADAFIPLTSLKR